MKRFLAFTIVLVMCISLLPAFSLTAAAATSGDFTYTVSNGEATITGYTGSATDLVIPSTLGGYPVTSIGEWAFERCSNLVNIDIPDSVRAIGDHAFMYCISLTNVIIPNGVTEIEEGAFRDCHCLEMVTIPASVTSIRTWAFDLCPSITDVYYGGTEEEWNAISIGDYNTDLTNANIHFIELPEYEYVISLAAFNTGNMKTSLTTYKTTPVLRKVAGGLYYKDAMHWDYEVAANYAADGVAFKAMNLNATAPWALEGYKAADDPSKLGESNFELSFDSSTFGTNEPAYAAFRIKVETAGTYDLQANAVASASAAVPAVYFAKAGTDEEELLGYYDIPESDGYTKLGTVEVEAGEYIVSFVCDATSAEKNTTSGNQTFYLSGLKLAEATEDEPTGDLVEHEFILGLNAFNKANMIESSDYLNKPVFRPTYKILYYTPAMHWDYTIPAEYAADGVAFKAMDLTKTDKWAFDSCVKTLGSPTLYDTYFQLEFLYANYTNATKPTPVVAFKIKAEAAGTYQLQVDGTKANTNAVPAVAFFKNGLDGVINNDPSIYPEGSTIGYLNLPVDGGAYKTVGTVNIDSVNDEYIIAFYGDAISAQKNINVTSTGVQDLQIKGIKLVPVEDDEIESISLSADKTELLLGGSDALISVVATWLLSGTKAVSIEDVTFSVAPSGVIEVSDDGVVTAIGAGTATITATLKADPTKKASIKIIVECSCEDRNSDHYCDNCGQRISSCADKNKDHYCDICGDMLSTCADGDNNHYCDICGDMLSTCADNDDNHMCDMCNAQVSVCEDSDSDHYCDICGERVSYCEDNDRDHNCDICGDTLSSCADNDNNHMCDICKEPVSPCVDNDKDHECEICGKRISYCADNDKNHMCDTCRGRINYCADRNNNHECDVCGDTLSICADGDGDFYCDICDKETGDVHSCKDRDNNHNCDYCDVAMSDCTDSNNDYKCDICGERVGEPSVSNDMFVITEAKKVAIQGSSFTYTVSLSGKYDGYSFEVVPAEGLTITGISTASAAINVDEWDGSWLVSVLGGMEKVDSQKTEIISVSVEVPLDAEIGPRVLSLSNVFVSDECGDPIENIAYQYATIEITDQIPGDINADGVFNYLDVSKLYAFYRGKVTIGEFIEVDINNDGVFNYLDVSKLYAIYREKATFE